MTEENSGGGVQLTNSGLICIDTNFTNCVSLNGGGGIYIKNNNELQYNITCENILFEACTSLYGGAAHIYIQYETNEVSFEKCTFYENKATGSSSNDPLNGGNALFLTVKTLFISNCTFKRNKGKGGALKVFNKFDDNQKIINDLAENDRLICIVN